MSSLSGSLKNKVILDTFYITAPPVYTFTGVELTAPDGPGLQLLSKHDTMVKVLMAKKETQHQKYARQSRRDLLTISLVAIAVLLTGTFFYHLAEHMSVVDALYFSVITLTTVGYGDITPHTDIGKLFTTGYVIVGIGILATFARTLLQSTLARRLRHER